MADGIIIIDKPAGWTSMDVCGKLRGILKTKKVGHAGTLDPMATGVLPVFVGNATRAVSYAEGGDKEYVAGLRLGLTTNTQDTTGEVVAERPVSVTRAQLEDVLARFTGEIDQVPPMYSAIKINGQKLYQLARKGQEIERPPRRVTIHELALLEPEDGDWRLRIRCSKGTYVRALCHDIGQALGCGGCMAAWRRAAVLRTYRRRARPCSPLPTRCSGSTRPITSPVNGTTDGACAATRWRRRASSRGCTGCTARMGRFCA